MGKDRAPLEQFDGPFKGRGAEATDFAVPGLETQAQGPTPRERLIVAMRDTGMSYRQMAAALGVSSAAGLRVDVARARKKLTAVGKVFQVACDRLDQEIFPLAVERLAGMVHAGVPEAVFRTLEGRAGGLQAKRMDAAPPPANAPTLNVTFSMPPGVLPGQMPVVALGSVVGTPRQLPDVAVQAEPEPVPVPATDFRAAARQLLREASPA